MLSSLLAIEDEIGYVPQEAIEEVATFTNSTINDVWGVASFYTNFRFTPPGEHVVEVCWGPTCHLEGGRYVLQGLLDSLHLEDEGETEDGRVTLKYNTCLGACSQAPVMSVDHHLKGRVTADSAGETVGLLRERQPPR
jgi:NADH:ubiquinone oxidoreductase subunit E